MVRFKIRSMPAWKTRLTVRVVNYPTEKALSNAASVAPLSQKLAEK
jgi:hypothetical protein